MSGIEYIYAGTDPVLQSRAAEMLCRCFDEWIMFRDRYGTGFPFLEISFAALDGETMAGHVGLMPFSVSDGAGGILRMAGVASVGTVPEYRGRGIASGLCEMAARWAKENGFDAMPLYTGFPRVYEKCGWKTVPSGGVSWKNPEPERKRMPWKKNDELSRTEKQRIIGSRNDSAALPGMVMRTENDGTFHSWEWLFQNEWNRWLVAEDGYALAVDGVLAEIGGAPERIVPLCGDTETAFLSKLDPAGSALRDAGWIREPEQTAAPACWHGECSMLNDLSGKLPENLFFPLPDKF